MLEPGRGPKAAGSGWPWLQRLLALLAALAAALVAAPWAHAAGNRWMVGPAGTPMALADAVQRAADGDTIELLPGEYRGAPLVLEQRRLTFRGVNGGDAKVVISGERKATPAKALWTVRGGAVRIESIKFRGARSVTGDGAALRLEGGRLALDRVHLFDNEHGVVAINDVDAVLEIESSVVGMAPRVEGGLHHLVNVGRIARFVLRGSRVQQGFEGHLIKSRARQNLIAYNLIHDGPRGGASYEIELPLAGDATIVGNVIGQGVASPNRVLVAYGTEGTSPGVRNRLLMAHNTLLNYKLTPAWFVRVLSDRLPADTEIVMVNNLLVGPGLLAPFTDGHFAGNRHALFGMLADADTYAFELPAGSMWRGAAVDPRLVAGHNLAPQGEFDAPLGVRPLNTDRGRWAPGAFQR